VTASHGRLVEIDRAHDNPSPTETER
jgi:hypothetical protein